MAKTKAAEKGQKTLNSFFRGKPAPKDTTAHKRVKKASRAKPTKAKTSDSDAEQPASEAEATEDNRGDDIDGAVNRDDCNDDEDQGLEPADVVASADAPIHDIPAMFADLVDRIPEIKDVAEHVSGRKLRVATMCSGTESPLLALELITHSMSDQYNITLDVEHVFSCEIEPFKQAYIERNFHPPLLFRDVCELGGTHATTAYGALAPVPGDVDLLVAGTSCVDYSNLNNEKQDIEGHGESGRTFFGMLGWVKNHRPPIVILENVCSAPWERVAGFFERIGYSATYTRVDTKQFYIPHTRTRVYLVAVNKKKSSIPDKWKHTVTKDLKRPASSTLDAFLLPSDDPRIHQSRQKLVQEGFNGIDKTRARTDWGRCESRHQRARVEEALGQKRPLTGWEEGGFCRLPDYAWNDWGVGQVERVWDLMDISVLRYAKEGIDPSFKTQVWNLSQNVDRSVTGKPGICQCLTPSMIPYITNRGGPMVGLEALWMQGLPVDKLLLTRETEDQLADLAGNAMSTTVVGACMLAALVHGKSLLKAGDDKESYETKGDTEMAGVEEDVAMNSDRPQLQATLAPEDRVGGIQQLVVKDVELSVTSVHGFSELLQMAQQSARLCECEGRKDVTARQMLRCVDCDGSSCRKCAGRPEHNMAPIDFAAYPRVHPSVFAKELKAALPMCVSIAGVTQELLQDLKSHADFDIPEKRWAPWCAAVLRAAEHELRFVEPKRQEIWSAIYSSPHASLELLLHPQQAEWRFYAHPPATESVKSDLRHMLQLPVARLLCNGAFLNGRWEFALPYTTSFKIGLKGVGDLVPAWEARLGLTGEFAERKVSPKIQITVHPAEKSRLERDISGTYQLLDKCGTANGALHKKIAGENDNGLAPLFMFLDPTRCGPVEEDPFVFSISKRRYEFGETRPIICTLDPKWRPSANQDEQAVECYVPVMWAAAPLVELKPSEGQVARCFVPGKTLDVAATLDSCQSANALLVGAVDLRNQAGPEWTKDEWREVDKAHERQTYRALGFLTERIRIDDAFKDWQVVDLPADLCNCEHCAPTKPTLRWAKRGKKVIPIEDSVEAGEYERRLKQRPTPFITQLKLDLNGIGHIRVGINIASLLHRALSRLPSAGRTEAPALTWRLNTDFTPTAKLIVPKFQLLSNKPDAEHAQPPHFKIPLRKEQLRSLEWMLAQESPDASPFVEEEISEAILEPLGWRAEGRARRPVHIRGGVLADQVGYGKTAITLGLIDCASKSVKQEFARKENSMTGKIPVKATLVIVPPHLCKQWNSEVSKFTGKHLKTVVLFTTANLNSLTIEDVQEADIVIVASNLFHGIGYSSNLEAFAAGGSFPASAGRYFDARLDKSLVTLAAQVERLKAEGPKAVMDEILAARKRDEEEEARATIPTKRLKGKSYREAAKSKALDGTRPERVGKGDNEVDDVALSETGAPLASKSKASPKGWVPEVVLPMRIDQSSPGSRKSAVGCRVHDDADSEVPKPRQRRSVKRKTIVISDDEDGADDGASSDFNPDEGAKGGRSHPPTSDDSDGYDDESVDESASDESAPESNSDDDVRSSKGKDKGKAKSKPKPKAPKKAPTKRASSSASSTGVSDTDDSMDVDQATDESSKAKASRKRKIDGEDSDRPAKKQKRREETDPWKLKDSRVKKDWTQMKCPPLEMFHFSRKVVDEYTYLDGKDHSMVVRLSADRHWVLSGTPPTHDFAALKTIAAFLDIHLGVDDDGESLSAQVKKRLRERTNVEQFHSFREVHTHEWHAHRHAVGQMFLNRFVRQNIAEIDEIPWSVKEEVIELPAAERAIYLELEHHLRALDMTIKRGGKKQESDRDKRLAKALGESSTAEEALLKRCSHFDLETKDNENAMKACEVIVKERTKQLEECKKDLLESLQTAVKQAKKIGKTGDESLFQQYVRLARNEGNGDKEATAIINGLLDEAEVPAPLKISTNKPQQGKGKDDSDLSKKTKELIWEHREHTHVIRRITKELIGRVRSLRYFTVVRDLQRSTESTKVVPPAVDCPGCSRQDVPIQDVAVLSSCGHTGCIECVTTHAQQEECVYTASGSCEAAARVLNIVEARTLGEDRPRDGQGKHFGKKLEEVVRLINTRIPKKERVLIFVQFPDLMQKVAEALTAHKVKFLQIKGSASQKSKNLDEFQREGSEERVLLLNVMDESASGANLTVANHAIFLSPLLAPTQEIYEANETQAIGRVKRFGQLKHVTIWRFLTWKTIDTDIYEQRTGNKVQIATVEQQQSMEDVDMKEE